MKTIALFIILTCLSSCAVLLMDPCEGYRGNGYGSVSDLKADAYYKNTLLFDDPVLKIKVNNNCGAMFKNVRTKWKVFNNNTNRYFYRTICWPSYDTLFSYGCLKSTEYLSNSDKDNIGRIELVEIHADRI